MRADIAHRMSSSSDDFVRLVWPLICDHVGGGTIEPVEGVTATSTARQLDMRAGIDVWQYLDRGMRGIASRVQWAGRRPHRDWPFRTFTIRKSVPSGASTEYDKRLRAITEPDDGLLYPHLTVQAYIRQGHVDAVGVVKTADLIWHLMFFGAPTRDAPTGETFYYVPWTVLRAHSTDVYEASTSMELA